MNPWTLAAALWRLHLDTLTLMAAAPLVVAHRVAKAGTSWYEPGFVTDPEWQRMVNEKVDAALDWNRHAVRGWFDAVAHPFDLQRNLAATRWAVRPYARRVTKNAERLGR